VLSFFAEYYKPALIVRICLSLIGGTYALYR